MLLSLSLKCPRLHCCWPSVAHHLGLFQATSVMPSFAWNSMLSIFLDPFSFQFGIQIRQIQSLEGNSTTLFGEWPHSCILYSSNSSQTPGFETRSSIISDEDFIGGASPISPGEQNYCLIFRGLKVYLVPSLFIKQIIKKTPYKTHFILNDARNTLLDPFTNLF